MTVYRRDFLKSAGALAASAGALAMAPAALARIVPFSPMAGPRSRLVYVNDIAGDIDGLYATVHALLSHTAQMRAIVGTGTGSPSENANAAAALAREMVDMMGLTGTVAVHAGAASRLAVSGGPSRSPGVQAIIDEAMRDDTALPLYVAVGGGLTEVASAVMIEPKVAERITLVWIGGDAWPDGGKGETNFNIDAKAAQFLFNETQVPIWQVPRSVYATCVISDTELQAMVAPHGRIGAWLYQKVVDAPQAIFKGRINLGETWTLGDSPLVVLTSLTDWVPGFANRKLTYDRTGAGHYDEVIAPLLNADGTFTARSEGRKIRIYKDIDTRLMFGDFFAKLAVNFPAK